MLRNIAITLAVTGAFMALAPAAEAMHHGQRHRAAAPKLVPAHLRPGYVGAPGYAAGAPGPRMPTLIDFGRGDFSPLGPFTGAPLLGGLPIIGQIVP